MKKLIILALLASSSMGHAQSVTATLTNFGMAPVPAFALRKPAAFVVFDAYLLKKKGFSIEVSPDLAINLTNGQGWFGDTWISVNKSLDTANHWLASVAVNWSIIFSEQSDGTMKSIPYPTERVRLQYVPNSKNTFDVEVWHTTTVPLKDGIKGEYVSFQYIRSQPMHAFVVAENLNLFHLGYSDGTKGFAGSCYTSVAHKSGFFIGYRYTHTISATHLTHAQSVIVGYTRKLHF